eukprot:scaffold1800_cov387-Prasinococcus_capsulatus_cf.AAC.12
MPPPIRAGTAWRTGLQMVPLGRAGAWWARPIHPRARAPGIHPRASPPRADVDHAAAGIIVIVVSHSDRERRITLAPRAARELCMGVRASGPRARHMRERREGARGASEPRAITHAPGHERTVQTSRPPLLMRPKLTRARCRGAPVPELARESPLLTVRAARRRQHPPRSADTCS